MRWYDIVSGILLILFIIDFALAAPVLVQEKCQACVYVAHIPRDATTVLGKRGGKDLEKLLEEYFNAMGRPVESSGTHKSLSTSAPPGPDHASTSVVQPPVPNPASSTAGPNPLIEPSIPSSTESTDSEDYGWLFETEGDDASHKPLNPSTLSGYKPGLDHGLTGADAPQPNLNSFTFSGYKPGLDHGLKLTGADAPQSNLYPFSLSGGLDHGFTLTGADAPQPNLYPFKLSGYKPPKPGLDHGLTGADAPQPNLNSFTLSGYKPGLDHGLTKADAPQPNLNSFTLSGYKPGLDRGLTGADAPQLNLNPNSKKRPLTDPDGPDPNFDESPPRPAKLPKESGQANGYQVEHVEQPNLDVDLNQPPVPVSEEHTPLTSAQLPTDPELHLDH